MATLCVQKLSIYKMKNCPNIHKSRFNILPKINKPSQNCQSGENSPNRFHCSNVKFSPKCLSFQILGARTFGHPRRWRTTTGRYSTTASWRTWRPSSADRLTCPVKYSTSSKMITRWDVRILHCLFRLLPGFDPRGLTMESTFVCSAFNKKFIVTSL